MKLPIGIIARFALSRIVLPAIGKAVADGKNPLTKDAAKGVLIQAVQDAAMREMAKRDAAG